MIETEQLAAALTRLAVVQERQADAAEKAHAHFEIERERSRGYWDGLRAGQPARRGGISVALLILACTVAFCWGLALAKHHGDD